MKKVLARNTNGILGLNGDDGFPYTVPLSYVYYNGKIYFHCARAGYKLDCLRRDPKVSFTIVDQDVIVSEKYTSYFRSVIAFGRAAVIEDAQERRAAFLALCEKYSAELPSEMREQEVDHCRNALIAGIELTSVTGKEAMDLVRMRQNAGKQTGE